ncbi:MAG: 4-alpha-glucanotransferase, partial [Candidatus Kerfeldbacteria bacterium]|nr:4-alpha-glucanotransferase [Candidatus Kerfeldbacteria bacterium]
MAGHGGFTSRRAGVFLPVSALPGNGGIGALGPASRQFIDWLVSAGQTYWQILPLSIPDQHGSPYASRSSLAYNWLLVSPEDLRRQKWIRSLPVQPTRRRIDYHRVIPETWRVIRAAYDQFNQFATPTEHEQWNTFRRNEAWWLADYTLYQALKDRNRQRPWWRWPRDLHTPIGARQHLDARLRRQMDLHAFAQWLVAEQWQALRQYAKQRRIAIVGDLPFYVQEDSVDVWANRALFHVDILGRPREVAGVPPDYFNPRGQRWGNPVYRWTAHQRQQFRWWRQRFIVHAQRFDVLRFDHFQGLGETYHVKASAPDGRHGWWVPTPGHELLRLLRRAWPAFHVVAEDMGNVMPDAEHIRRVYNLPGIRMLIFGWSGLPQNIHHPDFIRPDCFYYSSAHDTNTLQGWWQDEARWYEKKHWREYHLVETGPVHWRGIEIVYCSTARVAMAAMQDVLG